MKRLIIFFLLIAFFLPFPAEGDLLEIEDETWTENQKTVEFRVGIKYISNDVTKYGFDVEYDNDILEYTSYLLGDLVDYGPNLQVSRVNANTLRIRGSSNSIDEGDSGLLMKLIFTIKKYENTTLRLLNRTNDFYGWQALNGSFTMRKENGFSDSYLSGPLGVVSPQWYPNLFSPSTLNYTYSGPQPVSFPYTSGSFSYGSIPGPPVSIPGYEYYGTMGALPGGAYPWGYSYFW
jgi:hypothetical protein